jgi:hypothetical protein
MMVLVGIFMPDSPLGPMAVYGTGKSRDPAETAMGVLGPTPAVILPLQAFETIRLLSGSHRQMSTDSAFSMGRADSWN